MRKPGYTVTQFPVSKGTSTGVIHSKPVKHTRTGPVTVDGAYTKPALQETVTYLSVIQPGTMNDHVPAVHFIFH